MQYIAVYSVSFHLLLTFFLHITLSPASKPGRYEVKTQLDHSSPIPLSISVSPFGVEEDEELPNNAPLLECGPAGGVEDGQYVDLLGYYMDPPCEDVQGYCRIKRNTNYTAVIRYNPKVHIESLHVKITAVQPLYGWETQFWPEYGVCGYFNLTCPQEPDITRQAYNEDQLPNEVPPTRGLFRVRVLGTNSEDDKRKPYLCRQIYLQFY